MKKFLMIIIFGASSHAAAFDKEDTLSVLQAAMMESNKDYNENQKSILNQDNSRIVDWSARENVAVVIEDGLNVEFQQTDSPKSSELSENKNQGEQRAENLIQKPQEVSMNDF